MDPFGINPPIMTPYDDDMSFAPESISSNPIMLGTDPQSIINEIQTTLPGVRQERLAAMEEAYKPTTLSGGQGLASLVMALAPIALGYGLAGNRGLVAGGDAAFTGVDALGKGLEANADLKRKSHLARAQTLAADEKDLRAQGRQAARDIYTHDNKMEYLEAQKAAYGQKNGGGKEIPLPPEEAEYYSNVYGRDIKTVQQLARQQSQARIDRGEMAENRLNVKTVGELNQLEEGGLQFTSLPTPANKKNIEILRKNLPILDRDAKELADNIRKNGVDWLGTDAFRESQLANRMITNYKNFKNMGANFTIYEIELVEQALQTPTTFGSYLKNKLRGLSDDAIADLIDKNRELNHYEFLAGLGANKAYLPNTRYPEELASLLGIPTDDRGFTTKTNLIRNLITNGLPGNAASSLYQTSAPQKNPKPKREDFESADAYKQALRKYLGKK